MNATVTLPIGDLDKLREDLKLQKETVEFLKSHQKEVKLSITERVPVSQLHRDGFYRYIDKYIEKEPLYVNFEDVKAELKKEAENNVIEKIGKLNREIVDLKTKLQNKETSYKKEFEKMEKEHFEQIEKIQNEHEEQRTKLEKEISILKGEDVDTEQEKLIKKLTNQVNELKNRSFLERLLNL